MVTPVDRLEDAIAKLTNIQSDLSKLLAVHEQRLNQHERQVISLEEILEKRREEADVKLKDVYETIRNEDRNILEALDKLRQEAANQHEKISARLSEIEKKMWTYMGGFAVIVFIISYGPNILKLFIK